MFNKALHLLLIFSLAFNIAFVGIWLYSRRLPDAVPPGAAGAPAGPPGGPPWDALALRPEQRKAVAERWGVVSREAADLSAQLDRERERLLQLMGEENPDWQAVRECEQRIDAGQRRLRQMTMTQMREMRELLTPEQRRAWFELMRSRAERAGARRRAPGPRMRGAGQGNRGRMPGNGPMRRGARSPQRGLQPGSDRPAPQREQQND
jgi:Spy/CpxP family protein refolding chaperone